MNANAFRDRLIDTLLDEALGGDRPPYLTSRIMSRALAEEPTAIQEPVLAKPRRWTLSFGTMALTATALLAAGLTPFLNRPPVWDFPAVSDLPV